MAITILKFGAVGLLLAALALPSPLPAEGHCPPGLLKKDPPCVPPGLARQGVTTLEYTGRYRIGERLPQSAILYYDSPEISLEDYLTPLPEDQVYVVVDDGIAVIDRDTYEILQLIDFITGL